MKINYKAITASVILTAAVVTPIAVTLSTATNTYHVNKYKVTEAIQTPIKTLNKFKASTLQEANSVIGLWNTSLFKSRPSGDNNGGLETALSIPPIKVGRTENKEENSTINRNPKPAQSADTMTADLGYSATFLTTNGKNQFPKFSNDGESVLYIKNDKQKSYLGIIRVNYNKSFLFGLKTGKLQSIDW